MIGDLDPVREQRPETGDRRPVASWLDGPTKGSADAQPVNPTARAAPSIVSRTLLIIIIIFLPPPLSERSVAAGIAAAVGLVAAAFAAIGIPRLGALVGAFAAAI